MCDSNKFGNELGLVHEVIVLGRKVGAEREFWKVLAQDEEAFRKVVALVKDGAFTEKVFTVTVDYTKSLAEMLSAHGFETVDRDITSEHFPHDRVRALEKVEVSLIRLGKDVPTVDALNNISLLGFRPAILQELIAVHDDLEFERRSPIVCLGSTWRETEDGLLYVPVITGDENGELDELHLEWDRDSCWWNSGYRFAAVRK